MKIDPLLEALINHVLVQLSKQKLLMVDHLTSPILLLAQKEIILIIQLYRKKDQLMFQDKAMF